MSRSAQTINCAANLIFYRDRDLFTTLKKELISRKRYATIEEIKIAREYDVSMADYPTRKQTLFKDFGTLVNKKMTEYILDRPKDLQFTNFMVMRRYVVKEICKYSNPYPYMTGLILRTTRRIIGVPMEERSRYCGKSNFTFI